MLQLFKAMDKLDRKTQRVNVKCIDKYLVNVDFPEALGKYLEGSLSGYVRFRVGFYHIVTKMRGL